LTNQGAYSIITDHLGTPVEAYDSDGKKVWEQELDIYGRVRKRPIVKQYGQVVDDGLFDEHILYHSAIKDSMRTKKQSCTTTVIAIMTRNLGSTSRKTR